MKSKISLFVFLVFSFLFFVGADVIQAYQTSSTPEVPEGYALTGIGYGSDDKKCWVFLKTAALKADKTIDTNTIPSGYDIAQRCSAGGGDDADVAKRRYIAPVGSAVTSWGWGAGTDGGKPGDDSSPEHICAYQEYTNVRTGEIFTWGSTHDGDCDTYGYQQSWLKAIARAPAGRVVVGVALSLADDGNVESLSGTSRELKPITFTVTATAGQGGTISPASRTVNYGATTTFTLSPSTNFTVSAVTGTCGGTLSGNTYTTNAVNANCTVIASFKAVIAPPKPSGTLGASSCVILSGASTCTTNLTVTTANLVAPTATNTAITRTPAGACTNCAYPFTSPRTAVVTYATTNFFLYHNGVQLATTALRPGIEITCAPNNNWNPATNKCAPIVVPPQLPDLTVSNPTPSAANTNVPVTFNATVTNSGVGQVSYPGTVSHLFQYDDDTDHNSGITTGLATTTGTINANGGTINISNSHTFTSPGTRYVRVCTDNNTSFKGVIAESNENNNCSPSWTAVTVVAPTVCDYKITGVQGYDAATGVTTNEIYANNFLIVYGTFGTTAEVNAATITLNGAPANVTSRTKNQINIQLGPTLGSSEVVVRKNPGCSDSRKFTVLSAAVKSYTVSAAYSIGGTVSAPLTRTVKQGETTTFNINPSGGYSVITPVVSTCGGTLSNNKYTTNPVTQNCSVFVAFTNAACTNGGINPPACTCPNGYVLVGGKCTPVTVSVIATTPHNNIIPGTSVNFTYTPTTNSGSTECRLLDNNKNPLTTTYKASSPIAYNVPNALNSYGYYVQCRNTTVTSATGISNLIIVNTNCPVGSDFVNGVCRARPTITAVQAPNGTITPPGITSILYGSNKVYAVAPSTGYTVSSIIVDGTNKPAADSYTFLGVVAPHTITATFKPTIGPGPGPGVVNGKCATPPNGGTYPGAPFGKLCDSGVASPSILSGPGPWNWTCRGTGGGSNDNCSANQTSVSANCPAVPGVVSLSKSSAYYSGAIPDTDSRKFAIASAPAGYSGPGVFVSSQPAFAEVVTPPGDKILAKSKGVTVISGSGWRYNGGAPVCNLTGTSFTSKPLPSFEDV